MARETTKRKRQASGQLRGLLDEVAVEAPRVQGYEFRSDEFTALTASEQGPVPSAAPFRLRAAAALLTYNASHFTDADFEPFVDFIQTVESISRWTATLERSEHAQNMDRLHLHVYIEFHKAPDWTSLRPLACKVRVGFVGRLKQVEAVQLREQQQAFQGEKAAADAVLETLKRPFKQHVLELVREWASQYSMPLLRYKFLVLRAGSRCGKSTLAKSLHQELAWLKPPYIQSVQDDVSADLRGFNRRKHGFLVFDNINNMSFILSQRALFQSNGDVHTLGQSKTGVYSYDVYLYRIPIVFTVDHAATWDSLEPWMAENMVLIELSEPCFVEV
ncbi:unnamed protein product [Effrenium voratum]|nr:unnamed protein product [Effrenium voratum]